MFLKIFVVALVLVVVVVHGAPPPDRKCRLVWTDLNKRELTQINVCTKELGWKNGREKSQNTVCTMKCVLTKENLIQKDGQISIDQFNSYMKEHFPTTLVERANSTFWPCIQIGLATKLEEAEFCKPYDPMIKCMQRNFANLCRGLP